MGNQPSDVPNKYGRVRRRKSQLPSKCKRKLNQQWKRSNTIRVIVNVAKTSLGGGSSSGTPPSGGPAWSSTGSTPAWPSPRTSSTRTRSVGTSGFKSSKVSRPQPDVNAMEMIICVIFKCDFFQFCNLFQKKEDEEEEGWRRHPIQPSCSFPIYLYSRNLELFWFCQSIRNTFRVTLALLQVLSTLSWCDRPVRARAEESSVSCSVQMIS